MGITRTVYNSKYLYYMYRYTGRTSVAKQPELQIDSWDLKYMNVLTYN